MKIKTYRSESVPKAVAQIKRELGEGAVILNIKRIKKGGFLGLLPSLRFEITAASEQPRREHSQGPSDEEAGERAQREKKGVSKQPHVRPPILDRKAPIQAKRTRTVRPSRPPIEPKPEEDPLKLQIEAMNQQIKMLKGLVNRRATFPPQALGDLMKDDLHQEFQHLVAQGVDTDLAVWLIHTAGREAPSENGQPQNLKNSVNRVVAQTIQTRPMGQERTDANAAVFLGPTGVGKTTTIAKLAARFTLAERKRVRLITLDTYRIAAPEQLRTYGEIIGVPVEVVSSVSELSQAMSTAAEMDRVLIDTTGHSPASVSQFAELAQYLSEKKEIEKHLVLSATTKSEDLREAVSGFECFAPDKLVFTKLDETSCYGGIVNELIGSGKPLSYLTDGQKVPEDLITPTPSSVADLLVPTNLGN